MARGRQFAWLRVQHHAANSGEGTTMVDIVTQEEADRKLAAEAAAKLALSNPEAAAVAKLRSLVASRAGGGVTANALRDADIKGGLANRMRVLYQVCK